MQGQEKPCLELSKQVQSKNNQLSVKNKLRGPNIVSRTQGTDMHSAKLQIIFLHVFNLAHVNP